MNHSLLFCLAVLLSGSLFSCSKSNVDDREKEESGRILVFSKTAGFRHESISYGKAALLSLGRQHGVQVDTSENAAYFVADSLQNYQTIVFLNTTGDILSPAQQQAFENYIRGGGGFVGIHAATDTEYDWPWYTKLVGGQFESHPDIQQATIHVLDKSHPATTMLPDQWTRRDEWYNFKQLNQEVQVLARLDETSYQGGTHGEHHPIAWYHAYDGGRAFYTGLGHTNESYSEPAFLQHIWGGIEYAMGK